MIDKFGVEYSDDGKTLIKCPKEFVGEYVIPEGVTEIGDYAFSGCQSLSEVVIPEGVTKIDEGAFLNCKNLVKVSLPTSLLHMWQVKKLCYSAGSDKNRTICFCGVRFEKDYTSYIFD